MDFQTFDTTSLIPSQVNQLLSNLNMLRGLEGPTKERMPRSAIDDSASPPPSTSPPSEPRSAIDDSASPPPSTSPPSEVTICPEGDDLEMWSSSILRWDLLLISPSSHVSTSSMSQNLSASLLLIVRRMSSGSRMDKGR
ncbi:uncharacterized protein LOC103697448 [Phoenix dactylifera]|uniref:Uncharacterized protein LOC103697448 n=1 Tax=Phoenix dactylifera TaxID=42345 RepID=A0A8B9A687_PHODC|nr:uncharacterized protein LOC103697448 [Phoenix dactylifera]